MIADAAVAKMIRNRAAFSKLAERGFPCVDGIYWHRPSPMAGGLLLLELKDARKTTGKSQIDLRPPARAKQTLAAVMKTLRAEHKDGFWYRGQRARHTCLYKGSVPQMEVSTPGINPIEVTIDALVPSYFRDITRERPAAWRRFRISPPLDYIAGPARAIFASRDHSLGKSLLDAIDHMLFNAVRIAQAGEVNLDYEDHMVVPGSTSPQPMLDLISIAQHYEYGSVMIDVSTSIDASVWFATRDWKTGEVAGSSDGTGVIYRIDAGRIARALGGHLKGPAAMAPPQMHAFGIFGLADIADRFEFLGRPKAQSGGSLLGMENFVTHFLLGMKKAVEVFPFEHATVKGSEISLTRQDICPPDDRGLSIFRPEQKFSSDPIEAHELQDFLNWMAVDAPRAKHLVEMRQWGVI